MRRLPNSVQCTRQTPTTKDHLAHTSIAPRLGNPAWGTSCEASDTCPRPLRGEKWPAVLTQSSERPQHRKRPGRRSVNVRVSPWAGRGPGSGVPPWGRCRSGHLEGEVTPPEGHQSHPRMCGQRKGGRRPVGETTSHRTTAQRTGEVSLRSPRKRPTREQV